jgi:hypothetical protein
MHTFLDLTKLVQEDTNDLNRLIMSNEIETNENIQAKKNPGLDGFTTEFYWTFREKLTLTVLKLFHKIQREATLPNSFYKASITLTPKLDKTQQKRKTIGQFP